MVDVHDERPFRVELPSGNNFRFQDMPAYQSLSGRRLKEMDFGWWEGPPGNTLWLLEVEDFSRLSRSERLPEDLLEKLRTKATDSLLILSSAWLGTDKGR